MKLNIKAFALTCGLIWGFGVFALAWWTMAFEGPTGEVTIIGKIYRGFSITPLGSLIGLAWALADGFIGGLVFAWLYNVISGRWGNPNE
jgi:hypothetical protein